MIGKGSMSNSLPLQIMIYVSAHLSYTYLIRLAATAVAVGRKSARCLACNVDTLQGKHYTDADRQHVVLPSSATQDCLAFFNADPRQPWVAVTMVERQIRDQGSMQQLAEAA